MYTKAIALAILAVAGVQAQSDYDYEDSDPTPTMASTSYMPAPTGAASSGYMPMPSNGTGPYATGSMAAAPRRPTRPSTRVPPVHRRLREALPDSVWLLSACCKPVESSRLGTVNLLVPP